MAQVYFSLGSNQGDRLSLLVQATRLIGNMIGAIDGFSSVVESEPWGFTADTTFYNMVLQVETRLAPQQVLSTILEIERSLGRVRSGPEYSSRIIDIDILFYDGELINEDNLIVPHPLLHQRRFVLGPLSELAPELIHPRFHTSVAELLLRLKDDSRIVAVVDVAGFRELLAATSLP